MSPTLVFSVLAVYFGVLMLISYLTSRKTDNAAFFTANKKSPWYLIAFGMIGTSISGVTFVSVPGEVGNSAFTYFQMVLGFPFGYFIILSVLMPIYYKLNLVTIYTYLKTRFGFWSYKTGSFFFLVSRIIGSAFRLFLVATVLQIAIFNSFNIPFYLTVIITILLIWLYTFKGGIKTVVWTDTLQTVFFLTAVILTIFIIGKELNLSGKQIITTISENPLSNIFDWDWKSKNNFFKHFFAGIFTAVTMTGLDQDMMQKNLTCRTLKDAQKNMFWFSLTLIPINLLFLSLGVLLYVYSAAKGITLPATTDSLYPNLAINHFSTFTGVLFLVGIVAAAFSSADSALTALTTTFCIDFLNMDINKNDKKTKNTKFFVHIGVAIVVILVILIFRLLNDQSVIKQIYSIAGYTYGPLLGLFAYGIFTKFKVRDKYVPFIALSSPIICYFISKYSQVLFNGYKFGFELLILNGLITFIGLFIFSKLKTKPLSNL
jgi:Na+/proline symporter